MAEKLKWNNSRIGHREQVRTTLTAQPESDGVEEDPPAVVAAVVTLRRVVDVQQDYAPIRCHFVPRQR